jgi:hypothetical protein
VNGVCQNQVGTFKCNCNPGFFWPDPNSQCIDNNECADPNRCKATTEVCRNTGTCS